MMRSPRTAHARNLRGEDGFTMVEMMIALALAAIMFMALGVTLTATMGGTADSRRNLQSADFITETIEAYRGVDYASVAVKTPAAGLSTLTNDSRITYDSATSSYKADINGPNVSGGLETLIVDPAGVVPLKTVQQRDSASYTIASYVTIPSDAGTKPYKRITTVVSWMQNGLRHERQATTYVAKTQRGLPLPEFVFKSENPAGDNVTFERGTTMDFWVGLTNLGARDAWVLSASGKPWDFDFYRVTNPGDTTLTTPLLAGNTGPISTDGTIHALMRVDNLPSATGGPYTITIRATSVAQPTVFKEFPISVSVSGHVCNGCTYLPLYLHNTTTSAGCTGSPCTDPSSNRITADLYADFTAPKWTGTQPDFDKDISPTGSGRWLIHGGDIATEALTTGKVMEWRWDATSSVTTVMESKKFALTMCIRSPSSSSATLRVQVLGQKNSGAAVAMTDVTDVALTSLPSTGYQCFTVDLPVKTPSAGGNWLFKSTGSPSTYYRKLYLRVVAPGSDDLELAYDSTTYTAELDFPTP